MRPPHRRVLRRLGKIDRQAFDAVATAHLPGLEYVLPRLSRTANYGGLWFGMALGLGASRRPSLRRAGLRGAISIMVASPSVNLVGKHAFRRKRPVVDMVPPVRIRWQLPTSHAFPSGHSASAAGFAMGVAMEAPRAVALPVAGAAAAVAFSRIYTGAHYPGDVLAGLSIGVLAAVGTRLVWPARPPISEVIRSTTPVRLAADGAGVVVVVNSVDPPTELLAAELPAAEIVEVTEQAELAKTLDEAAARAAARHGALAAVGGDGTHNAAAQAALKHDVAFLTIPGGAPEHFARALGIEHPADAIAAYRGGCLARADVGVVDRPGETELIFLNTAGIGAYTELVDRRRRLEGRFGKWPATAIAAARTLRTSQPIDVMVDGRHRKVWLAFVGNGVYGSRGPAPTWRTRLDDGLLDIRLIETGERVPRLRALAAILVGHLHLTPGYQRWSATGLRLTAGTEGLRMAIDGETVSVDAALRLRKLPTALKVFCPPQ
jgi:diacylglycerol kinase family enzyme/membrane-associated phospholipid phosphatase